MDGIYSFIKRKLGGADIILSTKILFCKLTIGELSGFLIHYQVFFCICRFLGIKHEEICLFGRDVLHMCFYPPY